MLLSAVMKETSQATLCWVWKECKMGETFIDSPFSLSNRLLIKHKNCLSHNLAIVSSVWTIYSFGQEPCHIVCLQHKIIPKGRGCLGLGVGQQQP